jgi:hypothetical protein
MIKPLFPWLEEFAIMVSVPLTALYLAHPLQTRQLRLAILRIGAVEWRKHATLTTRLEILYLQLHLLHPQTPTTPPISLSIHLLLSIHAQKPLRRDRLATTEAQTALLMQVQQTESPRATRV